MPAAVRTPTENADLYTSKRALEVARGIDPATGEAEVALIDAQWLLHHPGVLPCRQQLPPSALFEGSVDAADVTVLSVSYPWLSQKHPDPDAWHLHIVQHFLRLYFTLENKGTDEMGKAFTRPPAGEGQRVAIYWDWA